MKYSANELIKICEAAVVSQNKWEDRDSAAAQIQVGKCLALLRAGCKFEVKTKENSKPKDSCVSDDHTIWLEFWVKDFKWFDLLDQDEETYPDGCQDSDYTFYLPTKKRLNETKGGDWY